MATDFVYYFRSLITALVERPGWYGVFTEREPEEAAAYRDGRRVPPWDVVRTMLRDAAVNAGADDADPAEAGRAYALHRAAAAAEDAEPGATHVLRGRLDAEIRARETAAGRVAAASRAYERSGASDPDGARLANALAWARDDLARASARCEELRARLAAAVGAARLGRAGARAATGTGSAADPFTPVAPGQGPAAAGAWARPTGARFAGAGASAPPGADHPASGAAQGVFPHSVPSGPAAPAGGEAEQGAAANRSAHVGAATAPPAAPHGRGEKVPDAGGQRAFPGQQAPQVRTPPATGWGEQPAGPVADGCGAAGASPPGLAGAGAGAPGAADRPSDGATPLLDAAAADGAADAVDTDAPGTPRARRIRTRVSAPRGARFAGAPVADAVVETMLPVQPPPAAGPAPSGARFAGAPKQAAPAPSPAAPVRDPRWTAEAQAGVARLGDLRRSGESGAAYLVLCAAAEGPADRIPYVIRELERTGLGADVATLLWEIAALPPRPLAGAVAALAAGGRAEDCRTLLHQAAGRPTEDVAVVAELLQRAGRTEESGELLETLVRARPAATVVTVTAGRPALAAPLLAAAARVSAPCHREISAALAS